MKNKILILVLLLSFGFVRSQDCAYIVNKTDSVSGKNILTEPRGLYWNLKGVTISTSMGMEDNSYFLVLDYAKVRMHGPPKFFSVRKNNILSLVLENGEIFNLLAINDVFSRNESEEVKIVKTNPQNGFKTVEYQLQWKSELKNARYKVTKKQLVQLSKSPVVSFEWNKIGSGDKMFKDDYDVKKKYLGSYQYLAKCIM